LTGHSEAPQFEKLIVAPGAMRQRFIEMVHREIAHHQARRPARIIAKLNQLEDLEMCRALSAASQAGVPVDLIVRGLCCLAPGISGLTDNVHVRSIIGRFLEHSRIFYFADGQSDPRDGKFFIGSGDWMYRNLSRRVEVATPVEDRALCARLWEILDVSLQDNRQTWVMQRDGTYHQLQPRPGDEGAASIGSHAWFIDLARRRDQNR
jgi:polyphosphate kinase